MNPPESSRGDAPPLPNDPAEGRSYPVLLAAVLLLLCSGIIAAGYHYYQTQRRYTESGIEARISDIADLKVQQVLAWRNERIADARVLAAGPFLEDPSAARDGRMRGWLELFRNHAGYSQVAVFDSRGRARMSLSDGSSAPPERLLPLFQEALRSGAVAVSDPYREPGGATYIDVVAAQPPKSRPDRGGVLLRVEATGFLTAIVQEWPTPSPTAESLLVRREGQAVRFLSPLRHKSAGRVLYPLRDNLPASMAALGRQGVSTGVDYRGVPVVAALRQIAGTPWALVTKLDEDEVYAPLRQQSRATAWIVVLLLAACVATFGFFWKRQQSRFFQRQHQAQLATTRLEERYARLRSYLNDIVLLMDDSGRLLEANDRAVATYGYTLDALLRLSIRDLLDPSEHATFDSRWDNLTTEGSEVFEGRHRRKDGVSLPVEVSSRTFEVDGRRYCHSVIRDISDRRRVEERLQRASRAMRVLSASNKAVIRSGDEQRLLRDICDAITQTGGYPLTWVGFAENTEGKPIRPVAVSGENREYMESLHVTWDDSPNGRGPAGTAIRTGRVAICNDLSADADFAPWRDRAAQCRYRAVAALPLECEQAVIGALTIYASEPDAFHEEEMRLLEELAADLSFGLETRRRRLQQARSEAALLQAAAEFRALFDIANDAIFIADMQGRFLEVNQIACQRLGYTRDELLTMSIHEIDSPRYRADWPGRQKELVEKGEALFENVHVRKDGSEFPVEINNRVIRYRQQPAILGLARDISERKRTEAEAQARALELERAKTAAENANRAKSDFLANMSHEIRTPMNGILGATGLLLDTGLSAEQRDYAETIRQSADALLGIVNDVLDLSRIEARKITIEPVVFDMVACLAETGDLLAPQARAKGIAYQFTAATEVRWAWGDAGRVRQIVLNLLSNAIKFTDRGYVSLRVASSPAGENRQVFRIEVEDSGIGIAAEQLGLLFRKFSQVDSSLMKKREGVGLGLAISRELAEWMGGTLTVASECGVGSTFRLTLPLPLAAPPGPALPEVSAPTAHADGFPARRHRILVAEDNPVNQKITLRMLVKMGCQVDLAANGREAIEMIGHFPYDLVLMDCGMPEMDGLTAAREIRARESGGARVPIVALTAHAISGTRALCLEAGMDDYIPKPVTAATIETVLRKWIA